MVNIKVAVRIRPLSEREIIQKDEIIARKDDKSILVTNPKIPERQDGDSRQRTRRFAVDFCYDPSVPEDCSQETVYREIGSEVLHSMFEGYNACVLAYGHSASGKTYTIMGLQDDPGLTPRLCQGLFERIEEKSAVGKVRFHIVVSFLEIYNEKVRDLLAGDDTENFSLRVREHPKLGPYVQGLSQHLVTEKRRLLGLLSIGNKRRSTAATENNVHSSRSHAVFTIQFRQSDGENFETEKSSKVHLVDLAGSLHEAQERHFDERASPVQSKARLKEGANINKSLVTLGNVISALSESCAYGLPSKEHSTKTWQPFVPYRDSVLTWLLKDTLGGNSNTIMIATISPASGCLSETINTLRYAKRTKRIVNQPIVNEDPKITTIRQLKEEIARLKNLLSAYHSWRKEDEMWENWSELERVNVEESMSKWPEPGGMQTTVCLKNENLLDSESCRKREHLDKSVTGGEICEEANEGRRDSRYGDEHTVQTPTIEGCEIGDEKGADVRESVNDNLSHEIFSDSLESFSSAFLKSEDELGQTNETAGPITDTGPKCENYKMLHRNRPDLIKGISSRSKDVPSSSCTDVSNLSQSTSENSLNSSGSVDAQPEGGRKRSIEIKKKDKRSEIVEAVTSRLYVTKKKSETPKKEEDEDDGELEELKLCKRARMKLFDLSRKLAMTRKMKKTMDNDTQTDFQSMTVRVKEKCVLTDPTEVGVGTSVTEEVKEKPCVIMNQVFIPKWSNYVVECGKVVRIEGGRESGTQTENRRYANANTSPVKLSPRNEDFSDDSLELDNQTKSELGFSVDETFSSGEMAKETFSSENSLTSVDGMDAASSSGSSEDFVFYENVRETKAKTDRELYTITENSEQSDPSDIFSPVRSQSISNSGKGKSGGESSSSAQSLIVNVPSTTKVPKTKQVNWADLKDQQYLNINILDSKRNPFSVDTQLFGKTFKDQSTDTMFTSADSITFVFMGPAKPKTSVLMELIKRSLGKNDQPTRRRSRGVQCDANLVRSVSIDTATIALSRIAKYQSPSDFPRATSLEALSPDEVVTILGKGKLHEFRESGCQTDLENQRKSALKCSTSTIAGGDENGKTDEPEKPKKSVSWSGETKYDFNLNYYETEVSESNENACESVLPKKLAQADNDKMSAFLEEATELLRNINYYSSKYQNYGKNYPAPPTMPLNKQEDGEFKKFKTETTSSGEDYSTWPRRRPPVGKPPVCPRPRSRQSLFSRSFSNNSCESSASWNTSNLSSSLSCYLGDRSPSLRSSYFNSRDSPRPSVPKLDFSELEAELEESCRRLELAVEQDKIREEIYNQSYSNDVFKQKASEKLKRRKMDECLMACSCRGQKKCHWPKGYCSTLELDTFGPGSKHCQQLCMFCRKKETEVYCSAVDLNSECHSGRCRLNYYGYCPCSPVRLNHVSSSPRAYMQHLLTLRRQIVGETSRQWST